MGAHKWTGDERSYRACYYLSADGRIPANRLEGGLRIGTWTVR
jgi:hypothetical protein